MLVVTRGLGQAVVIRDAGGRFICRVSFVEFWRNAQIRIGLEADKTIRIDREEVDIDKHPNFYGKDGGQ